MTQQLRADVLGTYGPDARAAGAYAIVTDTEELLRKITAWTPVTGK